MSRLHAGCRRFAVGLSLLALASVTTTVAPTGVAGASQDPAAGRTAVHDGGSSGWVERPPLNHPRGGLDVATVKGRILAIGGFDFELGFFDFVEARRVRGEGTWRTLPPMPTARGNLATAELGGFVYAIGGVGGNDMALDVVERFDPRTRSWSPSPSLPQPRDSAGAAALGGRLYVAGGFIVADGTGETTASVLAFDPRTRAWTAVAPMPTAREKLRLVAAGRHLYAIGGLSSEGRTLSTVERYDPRSNTWTAVASMNQDRGLPGAVAVKRGHERLIVVVGGAQLVDFEYAGPALRSTEVYSLDTGRWRLLNAQLPRGRAALVAAAEADGTVLAIGGFFDGGVSTADVLALDLPDHTPRSAD